MLMRLSAGQTVFCLMNVFRDSEIDTAGIMLIRPFFTTQVLEVGVISVFEPSGQIYDIRNSSKLAP
jgi:hypothetical protein